MRTTRKRVLFVCTHNSCRSQMGEGFLRHLSGERFEVFSAGTCPSRVHPMAIEVMAERGIDLQDQRSKSVDAFLGADCDTIVTTCDDAKEGCPVFPGQGERLHRGLEDPARAGGPREEKLKVFRRVRDELEERIRSHFLSCSRGS